MKSKFKSFGLAATALSAALAAGTAQAVNVATDGVGEVAIAPYYTVRDGWLTTINLTNTTDQPLLVKVRFREALNSRDTLDFMVAMSAYDVFTGVLQERKSDGLAIFTAQDQADAAGRKTCTIPSSVITRSEVDPNDPGYGTTLLAESYGGLTPGSGFLPEDVDQEEDGGATDTERLKEGYIEFFVLGAGDRFDGAYNYLAPASSKTAPGAIENHDCQYLDLALNRRNVGPNGDGYGNFVVGSNPAQYYGTASEFGEPINALKFNVRVLNPGRGIEAGYESTTLANFYNPGVNGRDNQITAAANATCMTNIGDQRDVNPTDWRPNGAGNSCMNFVAEQQTYAFLEPSLNNAYPEIGNIIDDPQNRLRALQPWLGTFAGGNLPNNLRGIDAVTAVLTRRNVFNEWASHANGVFDEQTDWVVTFPSKNFYVDSTNFNGYGSQQAIGPGVFDRDDSGAYNGGALGAPFNVGALSGSAAAVGYNTARPESLLAGSTFTTASINGDQRITGAYAPFAELFDGESCIEVGASLFDRAEQEDVIVINDEVQVSPAPPRARRRVELCQEVNVITFNNKSVLRPANFISATGTGTTIGELDIDTVNVNNTGFNSEAGWLALDLNPVAGDGMGNFRVAPAINERQVAVNPDFSGFLQGAPVMGFVIKQRTFGPGNEKNNYASALNHSYRRLLTATADGNDVVTGAFADQVGTGTPAQ